MSDHSISSEKKIVRCQLIPHASKNTYVGFCARLGTPWTDFVPLRWFPIRLGAIFDWLPVKPWDGFKKGSSRRREEGKKKEVARPGEIEGRREEKMKENSK